MNKIVNTEFEDNNGVLEGSTWEMLKKVTGQSAYLTNNEKQTWYSTIEEMLEADTFYPFKFTEFFNCVSDYY